MIGRILGNRYEIIEKIGGGGMALVYKAKCNLLNRYVAVKVLRAEFTSDDEFISSFKNESQAAASLSHPNIVNIYDVGNGENDLYYIVMEYVKGKTLKQIIKEEAPLSIEKLIEIGKQISLALEHAHSNHIVHRDIKPHNILVTEDGRAKVTDFGIARAVTSSTVTNTGNIIGSVHYFSPEQARGGYINEKSDLYSLGIVLYEMATGMLPFEGEKPISIALKHINDSITPPSLVNKDIPKAIEDIILKATQKDQAKRYNNAQEVYRDLNKALHYPTGSFVRMIEDDDSPTQVIPVIKDDELLLNDKSKVRGKKKEKKGLIVWSAILTAFVLALIVTGSTFYLKDVFFIKEVKVPNIVGLSIDEAKRDLLNVGFKVELSTEVNSTKYEKGYVISQDPSAGINRKKGYPVKVTISKGPKLIEVPTLINKNINEMDVLLDNKGLKEGQVKYQYSSLPIGIIIDQNPNAREQVTEGTEIDLFVSQGPETKVILMPNLVGESFENAKKTIETSGLVLDKTEYKYDDSEKNTVISQSITAGKEVVENESVNLVLSKGPETVEQPSEEDELQMKTVSFRLFYEQAKRDAFVLKIEKIQNGISTEVHNETHQRSMSGKEKITIEGRGNAKIKIYFDDVMIADKQIDFETGKIND
ncbi:Stk1 family PASTA domain-containing Ser/Thr kinase [Lutibacter sp. B2]|nr:Stk1 family PASTA domain-containing Ser/Thr kinase [Lutibacter sp. B2]